MSELAFMPWYCVIDKTTVGNYELIPFYANSPNPDLVALKIENEAKIILKSYLLRPFTTADAQNQRPELPVKKSTVIVNNRGNSVKKESDVLQYLIAFCGISSREFLDADRYLCSENLKIVIQNFPAPISDPFDPLVTTRMKNGSSGTGFSAGLFREIRPWHVQDQKIAGNPHYRLNFDSGLANALWGFYKGRGAKKSAWETKIFPALFSFYYANTDGHSQQIECIYSQTAIERLFLGPKHKEDRLVQEINSFIAAKGLQFVKFVNTTRNWQSITYKDATTGMVTSPSTIFEAWIRELTRLRNVYAHGNFDSTAQWIWSLEEHLLLSSFVFPLLVKLYISQFDARTTYAISRMDLNKLKAFERILSQNDYHAEVSPGIGTTNWAKIISESRYL